MIFHGLGWLIPIKLCTVTLLVRILVLGSMQMQRSRVLPTALSYQIETPPCRILSDPSHHPRTSTAFVPFPSGLEHQLASMLRETIAISSHTHTLCLANPRPPTVPAGASSWCPSTNTGRRAT